MAVLTTFPVLPPVAHPIIGNKHLVDGSDVGRTRRFLNDDWREV